MITAGGGIITFKSRTYEIEETLKFSLIAASYICYAGLVPVVTSLIVFQEAPVLKGVLFSPLSIGVFPFLDGAAFILRCAMVFLAVYVVCLCATLAYGGRR